MKRFLRALLLTLGLAALPLGAAGAAPNDDPVRGPACGDITVSPPNYTTINGQTFVGADFTTAQASCAGVVYRLSVFHTVENGSGPLGSGSFVGDGADAEFSIAAFVTDTPQLVCVVATSERPAGRVIDQAPDTPTTGCAVGVIVELDGGSSGGFMR